MKTRIVERTHPDGGKTYVIQQRHFLFRWLWVDAWLNSWELGDCKDTFLTLREAEENLRYFDGTKHKDKVVG